MSDKVKVTKSKDPQRSRDLSLNNQVRKAANTLNNDLTTASKPLNFVNALIGNPSSTNESAKGYMHQFGFDESDYTEKNLSPEGRAVLRKNAAKQYGKPDPDFYNDLKTDEPGYLGHYLGRVAPGNLRKVTIDGIPYWQVLDQYDFNSQKEDANNGQSLNMMADAADGLVHGRWYTPAKQIASALGLQYNSNLLIPATPGREAHPESVEAFRAKTGLPYPNKTLGGNVMNALRGAATPKHNEKAMP